MAHRHVMVQASQGKPRRFRAGWAVFRPEGLAEHDEVPSPSSVVRVHFATRTTAPSEAPVPAFTQ